VWGLENLLVFVSLILFLFFSLPQVICEFVFCLEGICYT
jgi:hypothetical protein